MNARTKTLLAFTTLGLATTSVAQADFPEWEDHVVGSGFATHDSTMSDGVLVNFLPIEYPDGHTHSSHAEVLPEDASCNSLNRLELVVMNAQFDFGASIGILTNPTFTTRHNGGIINLAINGSPVAFAMEWSAYDGSTIGGVKVHVLSGGATGDCTQIMLEGAVKDCTIGLEEGWVDSVPECPVHTYDDLPLGSGFGVGDSFVTDGIPARIEPFLLPDGSLYSGWAQVDVVDLSCGLDFELRTNNCIVQHDFSGFGGATDVSFRVGEAGGEVNLFINGFGACADDWIDYDGLTFGGVGVSITRGGYEYDCTEVTLSGVVGSLGIGGQEHAVDCIEFRPHDNNGGGGGLDCATYDDMVPGPAAIYHASDSFYTDGILCKVRPQVFPDGSEYTAGSSFAQPSFLACGSGQELASYASAVDHRFADSIGALEEVRVTVADHGGQINFEINGDFRMPNQYLDLDGAVVGGVTVTVLSGGRTGDCTELLLEGLLENLLVGGGQHFTDCLSGHLSDDLPEEGDFNGDGVIDGNDLAVLLGAWNGPQGDLDGDGTTNGPDLAIMLGKWN